MKFDSHQEWKGKQNITQYPLFQSYGANVLVLNIYRSDHNMQEYNEKGSTKGKTPEATKRNGNAGTSLCSVC